MKNTMPRFISRFDKRIERFECLRTNKFVST